MSAQEEILSKTSSFCPHCDTTHDAAYVSSSGNVVFTVYCPRETFRHVMSNDVDLFMHFRQQANFDIKEDYPYEGYRHVNLYEITDLCDYSCSFCYTSSNTPKKANHKSLEEIIDMARVVKQHGAYAMTITGGEPTLHPQILKVIKEIRKLGLGVTMPSNAYRLGKDPRLARELKQAGLNTVALQLDTFQEEIQQIHRNNRHVEEKFKSVENCLDAGLRTLLIPTVTTYNLKETGQILEYAIGKAPLLYGVNFQSYYLDKTNSFSSEKIVSKEDIVKNLVNSGVVEGLSPNDFRPMPKFYPMKLAIHPDCGVWSLFFVINGVAHPLSKFVDLDLFYKRLAQDNGPTGFKRGIMKMAQHLWASRKQKSGFKFFQALSGLLSGRGKSGIFIVTVENFMSTVYQDEERAKRCATCSRIKGGINQRGCYANRITAKGE